MLWASAMMTAAVWAQVPDVNKEVMVNTEEDPSEITTISDIIRMEEHSDDSHASTSVADKMSGHNSYINIGYNISNLKPKHAINIGTGYNYDLVPPFHSDWGIALQIGHRYALHKHLVGGMLRFNLDAAYADFSFNHFKKEQGENIYSSTQTWTHTAQDGTAAEYHFIPWCLEKYETDFGMAAGPSITLEPFHNDSGLRNMSINVFYHVGYHASLMWMQNAPGVDAGNSVYEDFNPVNDDIKLLWGHGFMNSFGLNINYGAIGVGVEQRYGYLFYQPLQHTIYGKSKYKYIDDSLKVFVQVRF